MRPPPSGMGQQPGSSEQQKKSVFERLGHQVDIGPHFKRRASPSPYNDYIIPSSMTHSQAPMSDLEFGPRSVFNKRNDHSNQPEMDWRFQAERNRPFPGDRHGPPILGPPPMHYGMDMQPGRQGNNFFGPLSHHAFPHSQPPPGGPSPPNAGQLHPINPGNVFQRSSPKYDRHGNIVPSFRERPMRLGPLEPHQYGAGAISPTAFTSHCPVPIHPRDLPPSSGTVYLSQQPMIAGRWNEKSAEADYQLVPSPTMRMMNQSRRFGQSTVELSPGASGNPNISEHSRYTRWRERRDVITNLDRETARSSIRTDTLKSSLQHPATSKTGEQKTRLLAKTDSKRTEQSGSINVDHPAKPEKKPKKKKPTKHEKPKNTEPQDISDGEIVDDESSSLDDCDDFSETSNTAIEREKPNTLEPNPSSQFRHQTDMRRMSAHANGDLSIKKRPRYEKVEYSMDYETISDEDLDDFMEEKKKIEPDRKLNDKSGESEIELLNALGLDWANLVEMARENKAPSKRNTNSESATCRFSPTNYIPTLGISMDLIGPQLSDIIKKVCRT